MGSWLAEFRQDFRSGSRLLWKSPGFTLAAVLTLALGIGATSAIFTVLNTVVLQPLPFPNPEQLVWVQEVNQLDGRIRPPSVNVHQAWREQSQTLTDVGAGITGGLDVSVTGPAGATRISLGGISLSTISILGVEPVVGRAYRLDEVTVEGDTAESLVISHSLWQSHFGGDPNVVGQTVPGWDAAWGRTVIGVMPPDFWIHPSMANVEGWFAFNVDRIPGARAQTLGRLAPGVDYARAEAELSTIASSVEASSGATDADDWRVELQPLHEVFTSQYRGTLYLLLGAVGFVLMIAAVNVASLQLSRSVGRQSEMATRAAMGAGRGRLIRQLVTENILLALLGGVLGVGVAFAGVRLFVLLAPNFYPPSEDIAISPLVLIFTLGVSVLTGVVAGLAPAFRASRPDLQDSLKQASRAGAGGVRQGLRRALVVVEVAMALVLLTGAGLMINSYTRVMRVDLGFQPDNLLTMEFNLSGLERYRTRHNVSHFSVTPQVVQFYGDVIERLNALPGVRSVGMTSNLPPRNGGSPPFRILGQPQEEPGNNGTNAQFLEVSENFFETMGIGLVRGRVFTQADGQTAAGVAVINETLARQYFADTDPLGQSVEVGINQGNPELESDRPREIVGIVSDTRTRLQDDPMPVMYIPYRQHLWDYAGTGPFNVHARQDIAVRVDGGDPVSLTNAVREIVADVDAAVAVDNIIPMTQRLSQSAANERFWLRLLGLFAGLAVFLAMVGIYSVIAYSVEQRSHEFGLRAALGAGRGDIIRLVLREGLIVTVIGVVIGIGGAFGLTRLIASQLYGVTPMDPLTIVTVAVTLTAVALLACMIPSWRAAKVDPLSALRID